MLPPGKKTAIDVIGNFAMLLLFFLGIMSSMVGLLIANKASLNIMLGGIFGALGGALIGGGVTHYITKRLGIIAVEQAQTLLSHSLGSRFLSPEGSLEHVRRTWYHYHATANQGKRIWRHRVYRFGEAVGAGSGSLSVTIAVDDPVKGVHHYRLDVGVRGTRLIILQERLEGQEAVVIQIYPDMLVGFRSVHSGVTFLETWDGIHIVTKSILSATPLIKSAEGTVADEHASELDNKWQAGFYSTNQVTISP